MPNRFYNMSKYKQMILWERPKTEKHISNILYSLKYSDEWHLRHIIKFTIREISQQHRRLNRKL